MIGALLFTYEPVYGIIEEKKDNNSIFYEEETRTKAFNPGFPYFVLTSDLDKYAKKGKVIPANERFMPFIADVIEDLPGSCKMEPKTYHNCKLMVERHGSYYQFYHEETNQVLRIAMNSHYYRQAIQNK